MYRMIGGQGGSVERDVMLEKVWEAKMGLWGYRELWVVCRRVLVG